MRTDHRTPRARRAPTAVLTAPVAVLGTIALALTAAPAHAAPPERTSYPGQSPFSLSKSPAKPADIRAFKVFMTSAPTSYTVVSGDTISAIAARHGLRTVDVLNLNGLSWSSVIYPGQVLLLSGAPAPAPAPPAGACTVVAGDTISGIASRHGVTTQAVLAANGLTMSSIIYPGQTLAMPGAAAAASPAPPAPAPGPAPASGYVVQAGDTISGIASRHGVTTQAVLAANGLTMSSIIYPGQTLAVPTATAAPAAPAAVSVPGLDAEQIENARLIIQVGRELGVPDRGIAIALGTAMQESWIRNLDGGDRDSLGLFQQRPSTGWGTPEEIRDRVRSIRVFYGGTSDPNGDRTRGLLDVPGWQHLSFADAAQTVQISAHPDRYAAWEQPAYAWLAALG